MNFVKKEKLLIGLGFFFINTRIIASSPKLADQRDPLGLRLAGFVQGAPASPDSPDGMPSIIMVGQVDVPILPLTYNVKINFRAVRNSCALLY